MKSLSICSITLVTLIHAASAAFAQTGAAPPSGLGAAAGFYAPTPIPPPSPEPVVPAGGIGADQRVGTPPTGLLAPLIAQPTAQPTGLPAPMIAPPAGVDPADCPCSSDYWTVGGGFYFMTPVFSSNPAFFTGDGMKFGMTDFHQHMSVAPLAWIAHTWENGWGLRFRWFQFESSASAGFVNDGSTPFVGIPTNGNFFINPGTVVTANNDIHLDVYDFEATHLWQFNRWWILGSAGVRYAHYSQSYSFLAVDPIFGNTSGSSANNFSGAGPTMSAEFRRQIANSNLYLYGSARGSLLFGTAHQCANTFVAGDPNFSASQSTVLPVGELEIGGEWAQTIGRMRLFAQAAFVGQAWCGGNNASLGIAEYNFGTGILSNFGFVGGVFRAGVSF